jgi:hypothetical protein
VEDAKMTNQKWYWITRIIMEEKWRGMDRSSTKKLARLTISELKDRLTKVIESAPRIASSASRTNEVAPIQTAKA